MNVLQLLLPELPGLQREIGLISLLWRPALSSGPPLLQGAAAVRRGCGQQGQRRLDAAARSSSLGAGGGVQPARRQHVRHGRRQQRGEHPQKGKRRLGDSALVP